MNALRIFDELLREFFKPHRPPGGTGLGFRNYGRNKRSPEHAFDEVGPGDIKPLARPGSTQVIDLSKHRELAHG